MEQPMHDQVLLSQGAEAKVYRWVYMEKPCIIKERIRKFYRLEVLDSKITKSRTVLEARSLFKCRRAGILVPTVYFVDLNKNTICMEEVQNHKTAKAVLGRVSDLKETQEVCRHIGTAIACIHNIDLIHGDLTTSNILYANGDVSSEPYLTDFGLSYISASAEDQAVDLYVLERALVNTYPNGMDLFRHILLVYLENTIPGRAREVADKLEEVRARGRKRVMIG